MNMYDPINRNDAIEAAKNLLRYHGENLTDELIDYFARNAMGQISSLKDPCEDCQEFDCCGCEYAEHGVINNE